MRPPAFPTPTKEYDPSYFNTLLRIITQYLLADAAEEGLGAHIDFSTIPTTGYGLAVGFVYNSAGFLKVVMTGDVFAASFGPLSRMGTATAA